MILRARPGGFVAGDRRLPCALGRGGLVADKREGDGGSPIGRFPLRHFYYRPDRLLARPAGALAARALSPDDGWCDDPRDPAYNRPVKLPFAAGHERLWRADHVYDLIVVLGHNDDPVEPGRGSAIFLHVAQADWRATEGCVALALGDLLWLLSAVPAGSVLEISPD